MPMGCAAGQAEGANGRRFCRHRADQGAGVLLLSLLVPGRPGGGRAGAGLGAGRRGADRQRRAAIPVSPLSLSGPHRQEDLGRAAGLRADSARLAPVVARVAGPHALQTPRPAAAPAGSVAAWEPAAQHGGTRAPRTPILPGGLDYPLVRLQMSMPCGYYTTREQNSRPGRRRSWQRRTRAGVPHLQVKAEAGHAASGTLRAGAGGGGTGGLSRSPRLHRSSSERSG